MKKKIKKLLFQLSKNSRISTKQLGKKIKVSQQSASYLVRQLEKKQKIEYYTIVDPVKLGYVNLIVGFNFLNFEKEIKKEIIEELRLTPHVVSIQEAAQGVDLIVEYSANNLSAFNKTHSEMAYKYRRSLDTKFILPVIVKHLFTRNYLINSKDNTDLIISGDRKKHKLSENDLKVLRELIIDPQTTYNALSRNTKISVKSIIKSKKKLESLSIIRGYSCFTNDPKFGIHRYQIFLNLASHGIEKMNKLREYALMNKNIIEMTKIIGSYDIVLTVEELEKTDVIKDLRSQFPIDDYLIAEIETTNILSYLPLEATNI